MKLLHNAFRWLMLKRFPQVQYWMQHPFETQNLHFSYLMYRGKDTLFGKEFKFSSIKKIKDFKKQVPLFTYEQLYPYIEKHLKGKQNVLWSSPIQCFAKSSGTTNASSKFIPVSPEALQEGHYKAGKDLLAMYICNYIHYPYDSQLGNGKNISLGGSLYPNEFHPKQKTTYGDVSAVIMKNLPLWAKWYRTPCLSVALMRSWEEKIDRMAKVTVHKKITFLSGVPSWTLLFLEKILAITQKKHIHEVWPHLELFIHGAVAFQPYAQRFRTFFPEKHMHYMEVYNAAEGFFAVQDLSDQNEMVLLVDHGIFYEFIPFDNITQEQPDTIGLEDVQLGITYAMVITTNAGLWRYRIGDTVQFTSLQPFRIKIVGRTKHYINVVGEELMVHNAEMAVAKACQMTNATIDNYTAGPKYCEKGNPNAHEWLIEFIHPPKDLKKFVSILDQALQELNVDYATKRHKDLVLPLPLVHPLPKGTFYRWMKRQGKLGGQHKVPRLANERKYIEAILAMLKA